MMRSSVRFWLWATQSFLLTFFFSCNVSFCSFQQFLFFSQVFVCLSSYLREVNEAILGKPPVFLRHYETRSQMFRYVIPKYSQVHAILDLSFRFPTILPTSNSPNRHTRTNPQPVRQLTICSIQQHDISTFPSTERANNPKSLI
ncbi:hypothetical protein B0H65DRAFT_218792 [Neurospora tetraspora]|uniref:Uncharacterized protein n=1 Tax=Neurospora tetraspora TaxID=94610 RepID=A0AAE0JDD1_9PEZI|nr:hypothetical protein B0H65DRAFT_218792 [Neurospora tetraspora]